MPLTRISYPLRTFTIRIQEVLRVYWTMRNVGPMMLEGWFPSKSTELQLKLVRLRTMRRLCSGYSGLYAVVDGDQS